MAQHIFLKTSKKFDKWISLYLNPESRPTYLNATQSAIVAYGYNPICQYNLASVVGSRNIRKYKVLARTELDRQGYTFAHLIEIGARKVEKGNFDDWVKFMRFLGY